MLTTKSIKSFTDLRLNPGKLSRQASEEGPIYILERNKPVSVLMDVAHFEAIMEELQDARDSRWLKDREQKFKSATAISSKDLKKIYHIST